MTRTTIFTLLGWSVAGLLLGLGLAQIGAILAGAALILAGIGVFAATSRSTSIPVVCSAAIAAMTPELAIGIPLWACILGAFSFHLLVCDLSVRFI